MAFAAAEPGTNERNGALHILVWFCFSAVFWIAGGLVASAAQIPAPAVILLLVGILVSVIVWETLSPSRPAPRSTVNA